MFGRLSDLESLRDVVLATRTHAAKSTLADADTKRDIAFHVP